MRGSPARSARYWPPDIANAPPLIASSCLPHVTLPRRAGSAPRHSLPSAFGRGSARCRTAPSPRARSQWKARLRSAAPMRRRPCHPPMVTVPPRTRRPRPACPARRRAATLRWRATRGGRSRCLPRAVLAACRRRTRTAAAATATATASSQ
eukprot:213823-Prymnesium_polylepis.2